MYTFKNIVAQFCSMVVFLQSGKSGAILLWGKQVVNGAGLEQCNFTPNVFFLVHNLFTYMYQNFKSNRQNHASLGT